MSCRRLRLVVVVLLLLLPLRLLPLLPVRRDRQALPNVSLVAC